MMLVRMMMLSSRKLLKDIRKSQEEGQEGQEKVTELTKENPFF